MKKMKKIKIYREINVQKVRYKEAIEAEPVIDDNLAIYKDEKTNEGIIIDIKTGLMISCGRWRKGAIDNFNLFHAKTYYDFIETIAYQNIIKKFNELEEYHPEVNLDIAESETEYED